MPIRPELLPLYPGGSITSPEWLAIRSATLILAGYRCEFCGVKDLTTIVRGHDDTYMTLGGEVFDDRTGQFLRNVDILIYRGTFVDIRLQTAHLDHDPTNNISENLKSLCPQCHNRHDAEHRRQTKRSRKAIGDLFDVERQAS